VRELVEERRDARAVSISAPGLTLNLRRNGVA